MASFTFGLKIDLVWYFFRRKITAIFLASIPFLETKSARSVISRKAPQMQFMRKNVEKHAKDYQMFVCKICMYFVYRHLCPTCSFHRIYIHPCNVEDVFIYTNDMILLDLFLCFEKILSAQQLKLKVGEKMMIGQKNKPVRKSIRNQCYLLKVPCLIPR